MPPLLLVVVLSTTQCSAAPRVAVWLEEGTGRDALRFGVGTQMGVRARTLLKSIAVRACASGEPGGPEPERDAWLVSAPDNSVAIDSTFVYGIAPVGLVTRRPAQFLDRGCYVIDVRTESDSARLCFSMTNLGEVTALETTPSECRAQTHAP